MELTLQASTFPVLRLTVADKEYQLCYPLTSVAKAEEMVGKSLKSLNDWLNLDTKDLPPVIEAGFLKYHADLSKEAIDGILGNLTVEMLSEIHYALCKLAFPKTMQKVEEETAKRMAGEAPALPNV